MTDHPRLVAGRYALRAQIGNGNLSRVFKATDNRSPREPVAIKLLNTAHPDDLRREFFRRETRSLERLQHPNIVRILDHGWCDANQCFYIVLELLGRTLLDELSSHPDPSDNDWCWPLMRQLADGLAYAHSEGVIHRDIKPLNVLFDDAGVPKLTDFGISRLKYELATGVTVSSFWSAGYAAPEQRQGNAGDERSDAFSLGAVFYHLLSRSAPPSDGPSLDMVEALRIFPIARRTLKEMLAVSPEHRLADVGQVQRALATTVAAPEYFLVVTDAARRHLYQCGLIGDPSYEEARDRLIEELGGQDLKPVFVMLNRDPGDVTIITDQVRLICTRHQGSPALVIRTVQLPYGPNMEAQRSAAVSIRGLWQPVPSVASLDLDANRAAGATREMDVLFDQLSTQKRVESVKHERRGERREFAAMWERILDYQDGLLREDTDSLAYRSVQDDGDLLAFTLTDIAPDSLPWLEGSPLAVRSSGKRDTPVGLLVDIAGTAVRVSRIASRNPHLTKSRQDLPDSGVLTLDRAEEAASLQRQRNALGQVRSGDCANPSLPAVLVDIRRARFDEPDNALTFFQDGLAPDKRDAVRQALAARDLFLIQGPPGTGKTTAITEIILQILAMKPDSRILVSSQSNVAVNNVLSRLTDYQSDPSPEIIRLGRAEKIGQGAEKWGLGQRLADWRSQVVDRTDVVLREMTARSRRLRKQSQKDQQSADIASDLALCRDWLEEASALLEARIEDEERYAALTASLTDRRASLGATQEEVTPNCETTFDEEIQALGLAISEQRKGVSDHIETVRSFLPTSMQGTPSDDPSKEIDRLRGLIAQYEEGSTTDDNSRDVRSLIREWSDVFGLTDDFAAPLLKRANILAATCLFVGGRTLRDVEFDWAIVDEAGRATAPEVLVALVRSRRAILVGDERQLPPLLDEALSPERLEKAGIQAEGLEKSLFEELVEDARRLKPEAVRMLTVQHRMHPAIGRLISTVFYNGQLQTGVSPEERDHHLNWVPRPVVWLSTATSAKKEEIRRGTTFVNPAEADVVEDLLSRMEKSYREVGQHRGVGVISGYSGQIDGLLARLRPADRDRWTALQIEVSTVDGFQGRDRDIVVYSAVRSNRERKVGFLRDHRRLNVALSRARQLLVIVGDAVTLEQANLGPQTANPFGAVLRYMRGHPEDCAVLQSDRGVK